ncbi:MAG TPA: hypothetical protein VEJ86_02705 [Candidatus Binataceae bacterium]|nr:hypothetical protein [Candidatus Binataceae bacterium]
MKLLPRGPELARLRLGEEQAVEGLAVALTVAAVLFGARFTAMIGAAVTVAIMVILSAGRTSRRRWVMS